MSYQQITIVGNVGRDPELKYTAAGDAVCDFSVAVNKTYKTRDGQKREDVTWYKVTCWRNTAEVVAQYVKKGSQVLVVADSVKASAYLSREGEPRASLEVTANTVRFLSGGGNAPAGDPTQGDASDDYNSVDVPF